ncbi:MAG: response regulator transcription factor [Desulfosarcina sp.]|nr:response regulator transcription factor [Desulfobacterales bacterium]
MSADKRILIVEDDKHIAEGLELNLALLGYEVAIAVDGISGLEKWRAWRPHLIVLDIMLPGIDGFSVLQRIRLEDERIPILILSARAEPDDRIQGLANGVDDYLTKPFNLEEFQLRVQRLLKRADWGRAGGGVLAGGSDQVPRVIEFGRNRIDFETARARGVKKNIKLTDQEMKLLKLFVANRGKVLAREKILEIGWGYTGHMTTRTVDNFIVRFRKYFEEDPKRPQFFKSVRSVGYIFNDGAGET